MPPSTTLKNKLLHQSFDAQKSRDLNLQRCTFSRANGPRVGFSGMQANPVKPHYKALPARSLFSKLAEENAYVNKDAQADEVAKSRPL